MKAYVLKNQNLDAFVSALAECTLYAPVQTEGVIRFERIENVENIHLDYQNSDVPPKNILFPQTETLFRYSLEKSQMIESVEENQKGIVFGIRPCDARSFSILDLVFEQDITDTNYLKRRENTIFIGLACTEPDINCFCTSLDGEPAGSEGLDMLFTPLEDCYFVEPISERGRALVEENRALFEEAAQKQKNRARAVKERAKNAIQRSVPVDGIREKLDSLFDHETWSETSMKCLGCSICTFLCPTCHCFDIQDETSIKRGARIRVWDSCSIPEYTLHASGHNPRPARMNRLRNRIYHKFSYFPLNFRRLACVGCGRCIHKCPVNIDILDVLLKVRGIEHVET